MFIFNIQAVFKARCQAEEHNWQQTLKTLPLNKLKEISKIINQTTEENQYNKKK